MEGLPPQQMALPTLVAWGEVSHTLKDSEIKAVAVELVEQLRGERRNNFQAQIAV